MRTRFVGTSLVFAFAASAATFGCGDSMEHTGKGEHIVVHITGGDRGAPEKLLPITFEKPTKTTIHIEAQDSSGQLDGNFNGYVRVGTKPGTVLDVAGPGSSGRNVKLTNGVADDIVVSVLAAYGPTRIVVEDLGYVPADPGADQPPQCSDGKDNDKNGYVDFPLDPGCAFPNDDLEGPATYAAGASELLYFALPRIADVRGVDSGGTATVFPREQVQIDANPTLVVTRVASDGFYVTDVDDPRGFSSVFAFTFSSPTKMRACDKIRSISGTAVDFYGFTELNFPTWTLQEYNPRSPDSDVNTCPIPEPTLLSYDEVSGGAKAGSLFKYESAMVRVATEGAMTVHVGAKLGGGHPEQPAMAPTADATNCDMNGDGKVDFGKDPEKTCAANCTADAECSEFSNFMAQKSFNLVVFTSSPSSSAPVKAVKMQVSAATAANFDPVALRGTPVRSFAGTLRYFSGGSQFTIEARCDDDIVVDLTRKPLPHDQACVRPRSDIDLDQVSH